MSDGASVNRRSFLGTAGAGLLGLTGWLAGCSKRLGKTGGKPLDPRFTYDVSQFEHTDPALLLYQEASPIPTGLDDPKCLAMAIKVHRTCWSCSGVFRLQGALHCPMLTPCG